MYNSVAFSTFTMLYNHHFNQVLKHFHHPRRKAHTHSPVFPPPSLLLASSNQQPAFCLFGFIYSSNGINRVIQHVTFCVWLQAHFTDHAFCNSLREEEEQGPLLLSLPPSLRPGPQLPRAPGHSLLWSSSSILCHFLFLVTTLSKGL